MIKAESIAVNDTTPTLLVDTSNFGECVIHLQCFSGTALIGDSAISHTSGFMIYPGTDNADANIALRLQQGEQLYGLAFSIPGLIIAYLAYTA